MTMTSLDIAASPRALSPVGKNETLRGDTLSIPPSDRRESQISESTTSRSQSVRMDVSGPPTDSEPEIEEDGVRALPKERARTGPVEDEAGPRFGVEDASKDSRAKPGEAGHSGIYNGDNVSLPSSTLFFVCLRSSLLSLRDHRANIQPFTDHMIRERVSTIGVCRPLEPPSELAALKMPPEEVGVIKEGQAMRYLNGQKLWDKKFHRTSASVEKHRRKNLKMAKERDGKKLVRLWEDRLKHHHHQQGSSSETDGEGWETDGAGQEKGLMDQSWSWEWALHGEAPPPSAIISRRDFVSPFSFSITSS
jgi:hypothetical protein